jgi:hypothetical protein
MPKVIRLFLTTLTGKPRALATNLSLSVPRRASSSSVHLRLAGRRCASGFSHIFGCADSGVAWRCASCNFRGKATFCRRSARLLFNELRGLVTLGRPIRALANEVKDPRF